MLDTFHSLASPPDNLLQDINTTMGFSVDAEAVFETSTQKPLGPIQARPFKTTSLLLKYKGR